jgi:hypothetical protein
MEKEGKKSTHGGWRKGAGRRESTGPTKQIVSISVDPKIWGRCLAKWRGKASRLVDVLLRDYDANGLASPTNQ